MRDILAGRDDRVDVLAHERFMLNIRESGRSAREKESDGLHLGFNRSKT